MVSSVFLDLMDLAQIWMVKWLDLDSWVSSVHLELELTLALSPSEAGTTDDSERVGVADLRVELDLGAEHAQVRNTSLLHQSALVNLGHDLALLTGNHPTNEVLALERAARVVLLSHGDIGGAGLRHSQSELGHLTKLAREASRAFTLPLALDGTLVPASLPGELTADIDVLIVLHEIGTVHPEDTIDLFVRLVVELSSSLLGPLGVVISPVTIPLSSVICISVRISQVDQLFTLIVIDIKDSIGVTLDDTFLSSVGIAIRMLWGTSAHQSLDLVESSEASGE